MPDSSDFSRSGYQQKDIDLLVLREALEASQKSNDTWKKAYEEMRKAYHATGKAGARFAAEAERLRDLAYFSASTGLENKNAYAERKDKVRFHHVCIDIDNLKWTNDNFGMERGDEILALAGAVLKELSGSLGGFVYHFHGDEFVALLEGEQAAQAFAARFKEALGKKRISFTCSVVYEGVGASCGVARTLEESDRRCKEDKEERLKSGMRASRGEKPGNVKIVNV